MRKTRRSEERVFAALPVILGGAKAITRDVSASGIFVETDVSYSLGEPISFSIELDNPGGKLVLKGQGDVVRIERRETKIGVALRITQSTIEPG
jgi:Tfp pilus assembly protein PilZ